MMIKWDEIKYEIIKWDMRSNMRWDEIKIYDMRYDFISLSIIYFSIIHTHLVRSFAPQDLPSLFDLDEMKIDRLIDWLIEIDYLFMIL